MITRWCGQDASNAFAAAGPPHHAGAVAEKGYGPLVVGALDTRSHRARSAQPGAAAAAPAEDLGWREDVGRQSWFHYHSVAAKYPENATAIDFAAMQGLVASLRLYPCDIGALDAQYRTTCDVCLGEPEAADMFLGL